jgi:dimethylhistidine N-methyltransferase
LTPPPTELDRLLTEVIHGLQKKEKELPTKLFYDERGSQLFSQISQLDEYYLTRTEIQIMRQYIHEVVDVVGANNILIEYGSGNSTKTRILLDHLQDLVAYVPVDISKDYLHASVDALKQDYPNLLAVPVCADYSQPIKIPSFDTKPARNLAYFPGSTIGNFTPNQAIGFIQNIADVVGPGGGFLVGVDLQKDAKILNTAYNDADGVTATFNLNILTHINRKFASNFKEENFEHFAFYNEEAGRIEMHLISKLEQSVQVGDELFHFKRGENILTEVSYKYTLKNFCGLVSQAGFDIKKVWTDPRNYFSIQYLVAR